MSWDQDGSLLLTEFLEVCIHLILYQRNVYPSEIFQRRRRFGVPVRMARHPALLAYIASITQSVHSWLRPNTLQKAVLVIFSKATTPGTRPIVLERFVFDVQLFQGLKLGESACTEIQEQLSAFFLRINMVEAILAQNPRRGCSWTILLYTNEYKTVESNNPAESSAEVQASREAREKTWQQWVPQEGSECLELDLAQTHPLKECRNAYFKLGLWVEESVHAKAQLVIDE
jgi:mitotic spindle assembly checkpoint protein MAD2B